jgi:signal transduction histidine kinase
MSAQASRWSERGAAERFGPASRPAELASLAASLDELLDRLAAVLRHEQQQSAELSHELRTPLARITAETDWLTARPRTPAQQRASHEAIATSACCPRPAPATATPPAAATFPR